MSKLLLLTDYGVESYNIGTGFGHFGIAVEDVSLYIFFYSLLIQHCHDALFLLSEVQKCYIWDQGWFINKFCFVACHTLNRQMRDIVLCVLKKIIASQFD